MGSLANVHILNKNTNKVTYSNIDGAFRIFAKTSDTLQFSSVGYHDKTVLVNTNHFGINENLFNLEKQTIALDEIEIKNHNLTGRLTTDSKKIKKSNEVDAVSLQLPFAGMRKRTQAERRLFTANNSGMIVYLLNVLSGRLKKLKKMEELEKEELRFRDVKKLFHNYIISDLKIDSTNVNRFLYYCVENKGYQTMPKDEMRLINYLRKKSVTFKKLNPK